MSNTKNFIYALQVAQISLIDAMGRDNLSIDDKEDIGNALREINSVLKSVKTLAEPSEVQKPTKKAMKKTTKKAKK